ncbi:MAG: hypothetical protein ACYC3Q_00740 [Gemmatimonadaceae bacterium]
MNPRTPSLARRTRRVHRYLGLFIGLQFLLWTAGGLYFSWTDLAAVHGDHLVRAPAALSLSRAVVSPAVALAAVAGREGGADSVIGMDLATVLGRAVYRVHYRAAGATGSTARRLMIDAETGVPRPPLSRDEAVALARAAYTGSAPVTQVAWLSADSVGPHHEFRGQLLPAWQVRFGDAEGATAYVAADLGQVVRIRNNRWRWFDTLWMLHTMDYQGRDNFNNALLRTFSVLGLATVLSGFVLFGATSSARRRRGAAKLTEGSARGIP